MLCTEILFPPPIKRPPALTVFLLMLFLERNYLSFFSIMLCSSDIKDEISLKERYTEA